VKDVAADGATTVVLTLNAPDAQFKYQLAGCLGVIASPTAINALGAKYGTTAENTVGAGPFILKSWTPQTESVFVRNPKFWDAPRPYLDEVTTRPVETDPTQRAQALITGEADIASYAIATPAFKLLEDAGFEATPTPVYGGQGFMINVAKAPFDDVRVRKAILLAVDANKVNDAYEGSAALPETFFPKALPFYDATLTWPKQNLAEAQKLIDEYVAEKGGPVKVSLMSQAGPLSPLAVSVQQQLSQLKDVDATVDLVPAQAIGEAYQKRSFDFVTYNLAQSAPYPEFYDNFHTGSFVNFAGISDPDIDAALDKIKLTTDKAELAKLYQTVAHTLLDKAYVALFIGAYAQVYARDNVGPVPLFATGVVDLGSLYLVK
jgi:peptide/nickel transport system substrate-binding protein